MKYIDRIKELKEEQNNFHQQQILDEVIVYNGVEMTVGFIIYHLELMKGEIYVDNNNNGQTKPIPSNCGMDKWDY